jgi:PAS domain S-box-containing protein
MYMPAEPLHARAGQEQTAIEIASRPALSHVTRLLPAAAVILPLLLTAAAGWLTWTQVSQGVRTELTGTAAVTAEYTRRLLDTMLLHVDRGVERLAGLTDAEIRAREAELHAALRSIPARTHDLRSVHLFAHDRNARSLVSGRLFPVPPPEEQFMLREFNQVHRTEGGPDPHLSPAYTGAATGRPFFALSRPRAPDPERPGYNGVVAASLDVEEASAALARLIAVPGDVVALVRRDGALLARTTGTPPSSPADRIGPSSALLGAMTRGDQEAFRMARSTIDGVVRLVAYRRVEGWPVYVSVGRSRQAVLAEWWHAAWPQLGVGLLATGLLFGLALALRRRDRALALTNAALEQRVQERTAALAESEARLRRVQEIGRVGGFEFDLRSGENRRSAEYMRLQGHPPDPRLERHEDWVRRLHPEDRERAERRLLNAIADDAPDTTYAQEYRIIAPDGRIRWIAARAEIERDAAGRALRMVGAHMDITELRATQDALAEREARLSAALRGARLGVAEYDVPTRRATWDARAAEIFGMFADGAGDRAWLDRVHPDDARHRHAAVAAAVAAGGSDSYDVEFRFRREDGGWSWIAVHGAVMDRDPASGRAIRLAAVVQDVTERREAEERQRLMARELDHRAKNALAVVLAALRLAPKTDAAAYARAIEGRVTALARAHTLLAEGRWTGASLRSLALGELMPFLSDGRATGQPPQAEIIGPPVLLPPATAQAISMALHELATNALKFGALSDPRGRVRLSWEELADRRVLRIRWTEEGGPPTEPPTHRGFGTRVLEATIRDQLGGSVERVWDPDGLRCELLVPLDRLEAAAPELP